jgi:hypothetical protein
MESQTLCKKMIAHQWTLEPDQDKMKLKTMDAL